MQPQKAMAISDNESKCKGVFFDLDILVVFCYCCLFLFSLSLSRSSTAARSFWLFGYLSVLFSSFSIPCALFFGSVRFIENNNTFVFLLRLSKFSYMLKQT